MGLCLYYNSRGASFAIPQDFIINAHIYVREKNLHYIKANGITADLYIIRDRG